MDILILFGSFALFLLLAVPIGIALGLSTLITIFSCSSIPVIIIAQNAFAGLDSFPLLAIPFFMLAGSLMTYGGISRRIVALAECLVGFIIGGLAMVTVVACMFFGAISGSGPATVSAIGSFMVPLMKEKKYSGGFAAALIATSGTIGVIIPPSIPFVIYGVVSGVSVGDMFVAGIIPGITIGLALIILSYFIAKKEHYPKQTSFPTIKKLYITIKEALWALLVPIIIMGGIYGGIFTPTEAAVVASVYALFIGKFIYKELNRQTIYDAFKDAMIVNAATTFMIGLSTSFAAYLAIEQIPIKIGQFILTQSDSRIIILLLINIMFLIVGCFVDNISSTIILTPIFLPVVTDLGMSPIHYGIMMTLALAIGFITPPYGCNLFVASAISGESVESISKNLVPFIIVMILTLLLLTFVPWLSLALL